MAGKIFLVSLLLLAAVNQSLGATISIGDIQRVKNALRSAMGNVKIPNQILKWMAVLNKHIYILTCLPTRRYGNCYQSPVFCSIPSLKFGGKQLKVKLSICTSPWKIKLDFELPKLPWYISVKFDPIVIPIDHIRHEGITKIHSVSRAHAKILGVVSVYKTELKIDATLRWDCTRPTYDKTLRIRYNSQFNDGKPGTDYNKHYYKLHVRLEVKKKKFWCFCWRCKSCKDLVKTQGVLGTGPSSCSREANEYWSNFRRRPIRRNKHWQILPEP